MFHFSGFPFAPIRSITGDGWWELKYEALPWLNGEMREKWINAKAKEIQDFLTKQGMYPEACLADCSGDRFIALYGRGHGNTTFGPDYGAVACSLEELEALLLGAMLTEEERWTGVPEQER